MPASNPPPNSRPWDALAAIVAALIGLMALLVSGYTAYVQRQQVRAQVWPYLLVGNFDTEFAIKILNKGVGPAIVRSVRMTVDGKPQTDWSHVLKALEVNVPSGGRRMTTIDNNVLSAGESVSMIKFTDETVYKNFLGAVRSRAILQICFCSTLGECWLYDEHAPGEKVTQDAVPQCPRLTGEQAFTD
ncbi:MAG: hypothetical protein ABI843_02060 [Dokdonella sp.]